MRDTELELWALDVIERAKQGAPHEDARVELKAEWPTDAPKAARQLAGLANAARADAVLWLVGVDEERGPIGANANELSNWWSQIAAQFDEVAPNPHAISVTTPDGPSIVALLFETTRRPYVVKCSDPKLTREIPWRTANSTRSARRSEVLLALMPTIRTPRATLSWAFLWRENSFPAGRPDLRRWYLDTHLYLLPAESTAIFRRDISATISMAGQKTELRASGIKASKRSAAIECSETEAIASSPGRLSVEFLLEPAAPWWIDEPTLELRVTLRPIDSVAVSESVRLKRVKGPGPGADVAWTFGEQD